MSSVAISNMTRLAIFWPEKLIGSGLLYGFRNDSDGSMCIVTCVATKAAPRAQRSHEDMQASLTTSPASLLTGVEYDCGKLCLLGTLNMEHPRQTESITQFERDSITTWPTLRRSSRPVIFVLYDPPNTRKFRFLSLRSIPLNVTEYRSDALNASSLVAQSALSSKASQLLATDTSWGSMLYIDMHKVLQQLNFSYAISDALNCGARRSEPCTNAEAIRTWSWPHNLMKAILDLVSTPLFRNAALRDVSATAHQIDLRMRQGQLSVVALRASRKVRLSEPSTARAQYISFYGTLWLIANDVIIGTSLMTFLCENDALLADGILNIIRIQSISNLQKLLIWLNDWPGGIKLNDELGGFFCDAFLWFTAAWEKYYLDTLLAPRLQTMLRYIGYSALLGSTLSLSLLSDLIAISTLHLYTFYFMATALFRFHTSAMSSLFRIFRGKKHNVEKNRLEPTEYRLDQLLLGSLLFMLAVFLFPTVLAYYLVFAACRVLSIGVNASFEAGLAFLNHFPLFAFMLRVKDPARLPGGVHFDVVATNQNATHLRMTNKPVPVSAIFHQYIELWGSFSQHYSPVQLLLKLLKGDYIRVIPRYKLALIDLAHCESMN